MGFSASGATAVIFIGLLVSAATLVPAVQDAREAQYDGLENRDDRMLEQRNTEIEVVDAVYNDTEDTLTVRLDNTGTTPLDAEETDLLVDGEYVDPSRDVAGDGGRTLWSPGSRLVFTYDMTVTPNRVHIATRPGVQAAANVTVTGVN
jgi:flagellar protein FlaF